MVAHRLVAFAKTLPYLEVTRSSPVDSKYFSKCQQKVVPRGSPRLGHVAAHDWATWHHFIHTNETTCPHPIHPSHHNSMSPSFPVSCFHIIYTVIHVSIRPLPRHLYGLYNQQFLPIWQIRQKAIYHSYSVRLNPFELRWVRDDEAYGLVHFEVIPSTLNFEQNLIPWITPPHWKAFGPPKDYFQSI
jgi:hypothetical protein